ncbi:Scaffold-type E3 ligase [Collariella sp. IMI 366227]|nr:Scaffold-type E3 ligase [Collariella sp. IMI 366227]
MPLWFRSKHCMNNMLTGPPASTPEALLGEVFDSITPKASKTELAIDGFVAYCETLDVDPTIDECYVLAEIVQTPSFGQVTREGFIKGWAKIYSEQQSWKSSVADNLALQKRLVRARIDQSRRDPEVFRAVYRSAFAASKEPGKRDVDMEAALSTWGTLFAAGLHRWRSANVDFMEAWKDYVTERFWVEDKKVEAEALARLARASELGEEEPEMQDKYGRWTRSVSRDLWNQLLPFALKALQDESLGFWSEEQAWPGLIDEFVLWCKAKGVVTA